MKILWLSNVVLSEKDRRGSGTWLDSMAKQLTSFSEITLGNISSEKVSGLQRCDCGTIQQWLVPWAKSKRNGLPPATIVAAIESAIKEFDPDLIHVWGVEMFWGLLVARGLIQSPALLEIQGMKGVAAKVFSGGLTAQEQRSCVWIKEILKCRNIEKQRRVFLRWGWFEREIIRGHKFITTQSPWVESWVRAANPSAHVFHTELALREPFYRAKPWSLSGSPIVFVSAAYILPSKGLHDAVRALAILKQSTPGARLRIAGNLQRRGIRQEGYLRWVNRLAKNLGVHTHIDWLGALTADEIVGELQQCAVMFMPSHTETYCVALAEAMYLGVPCVSAFTGGTSWLAKDNETALLFPPGDEAMAAWQIERALSDKKLASRLSVAARNSAQKRHCAKQIAAHQLEIYRQVLEEADSCTRR